MVKEFPSLDSLLQGIGMHMRAREIERGKAILQGELYHKPYLSALGDSAMINPISLKGYSPEHHCEMHAANYEGGNGFIAVLPFKDLSEKVDFREPIFTLKTDLIDYFLSARIGYNGFKELTFPDRLNVIRSFAQFPTEGFEEMGNEEVMSHAKKIDFFLFDENYSSDDKSLDVFSGWKRQFKNDVLVTQIKADNGHENRFNPMYFLAIHRPEY